MTLPALSPRERTVALSAAALLALVTADVAVGGYLTHLDGQIRDFAQPGSMSAPWWLSAAGEVGDLRVAMPLLAVAAIVACQYSWRLWPAVFAVSTFAAVELAVLALKWAVGRPGPGVWADRPGYPGYFPSGHSATAATLVAVIAFIAVRVVAGHGRSSRLPDVCAVAGIVAGLLAGARAVVGDTHWTSDVVGGLLLYTAIALPAMSWCGRLVDARDSAAAAR
jgi:undecaprenyl-diphosphatase